MATSLCHRESCTVKKNSHSHLSPHRPIPSNLLLYSLSPSLSFHPTTQKSLSLFLSRSLPMGLFPPLPFFSPIAIKAMPSLPLTSLLRSHLPLTFSSRGVPPTLDPVASPDPVPLFCHFSRLCAARSSIRPPGSPPSLLLFAHCLMC
jgi:hypothetical protein